VNSSGRHDLEVDIYQHPKCASIEQIVVTPTLVKNLPLPVRRIIGDLSDHARVLVGLDLVSSLNAYCARFAPHSAPDRTS